MSERVRQIRDRLAGLLPVLSDAVRADIEELLALAERATDRPANKTTATNAPTAVADGEHDRVALPAVLRGILEGAAEPMWVRDLTRAALGRGWQTSSPEPGKVVSSCLSSRDEFVAVARGRYVLRGAATARDAPAVVSEGDERADARSSALPVDAIAPSEQAEVLTTPSIVLAVLREHAAPMRVGEVAHAALARGWTTRSSDPAKLVGMVLRSRPEFVAVGRGVYTVRDAVLAADTAPGSPVDPCDPDVTAADEGPRASPPRAKSTSLRALIRGVLARRAGSMRVAEIVEALVDDGWTTTSAMPRDVVSAVLSSKPEFVAVGRGVYALDDAAAVPVDVGSREVAFKTEPVSAVVVVVDSPGEHSAPLPQPLIPSPREAPALAPRALRRADAGEVGERLTSRSDQSATAPAPKPRFAPEVAEVGAELGFLLQHVSDARADTAVLAPHLLRLQITAWIARARALNDRARGHGEITRATGRVATELGDLCKRWWPGSVEAMRLDTLPSEALRPFADQLADPRALTWQAVADRLDEMLAGAWAEPGFDDGWKDTRWLCNDERFVDERLQDAEALLARLGTPIQEPPLRRSIDLRLAHDDVQQLVHTARGLRWVRGVITDGLRWGLLIGRLRWIAATHPTLSRSSLSQVLSPDYQPLGSGWGFEEVLRRERKERLLAEIPHLEAANLPGWISRAIDVFDNPELARVLAGHTSDVAAIDPAALGSRRARGRVRKLATIMGIQIADAVASAGSTPPPSEPEAAEAEQPAESFASVRSALLDRVGGNRALFISNRDDTFLRDKLSATFGLDLEWCVAHPRRVDAATDAIRRGRYHVILSATGFQDHTMDAAFSRAAKDSSTLYVRVNRGRPAACARAIARELGLRDLA